MKRKWIFIPIITLCIIGIILGSFYDLSINKALYDRYNGFGLTMAAFGETPAYLVLGILGFGFIWLCKYYTKWWQRLIFIISCLVLMGFAIYFQGTHVFNVNAFYSSKTSLKILGFGIGVLVAALGALLGYFLFKNTSLTPKQLLFVLVFLSLCIGVVSLSNELIKKLFARPRFRFLADMDVVQEYFCNWWQSGKDVKKLYLSEPVYFPSGLLVTKEEFKSFPSGHMATSTSTIAFMGMLPIINNKIKLKSEYLIGINIAFCLLLAYTRMRVGAHFLSDVSFGMLEATVIIYVLNEIFLHFYGKYAEEPVLNE